MESDTERAEENAITVVKDDQGLLFLGDPCEIQSFLEEHGLASREFRTKALKVGGAALQKASDASMQSGRWVKLTKESAELVKKYGKAGGIQPGVAQAANGRVVKWLRFETPGQLFTPAMATGVAGMMTQMALEQAIQEITDYLAAIDEKVNDLLRDQKDHVLADLMGVVFELDEATSIRDRTGTLTDAAWSKVAPCAKTTGTALAYALTKLQGICDKLAQARSPEDVNAVLERASDDTRMWLFVVARAIQTRDRLSVIELERAFAEKPEVLEEHRQAIVEARKDRLTKVRARVDGLRTVLDETAGRVRGEKLLHPFAVDKALEELDVLMLATEEFSKQLEIETDEKTIERAPEWGEVAIKFVEDRVADAAAAGEQLAAGAQDLGSKALEGAQDLGGAVAQGAGALGDAVGKGAQDLGGAVAQGAGALGDAVGKGAQDAAKALESIDLGKVAESLPFKFPFGR